jgi:uncharacterized repeat protein (TIGR01451 family)
VFAGQDLTYTMNVSNAGPAATGATLRDDLPAGIAFVSATASQGVCSESSGTVTCGLGQLGAGDVATVTIKVRPQAQGTITNTATVDSSVPDSNTANNTATEQTTVDPAADLAVTQTDSPDPVSHGQRLTYTVTLTNNGPQTAEGVSLTDTVSKSLRIRSVRPSQGRCVLRRTSANCTLGSLGNADSVTITVITQALKKGTASNTASATLTQPTDPVQGNNTSTETTVVQ